VIIHLISPGGTGLVARKRISWPVKYSIKCQQAQIVSTLFPACFRSRVTRARPPAEPGFTPKILSTCSDPARSICPCKGRHTGETFSLCASPKMTSLSIRYNSSAALRMGTHHLTNDRQFLIGSSSLSLFASHRRNGSNQWINEHDIEFVQSRKYNARSQPIWLKEGPATNATTNLKNLQKAKATIRWSEEAVQGIGNTNKLPAVLGALAGARIHRSAISACY
jgi:hypothetical protein